MSRDQVRTFRVLVQHENEFKADMTVTKEALATSEPGAVATGQTLTFERRSSFRYYWDNCSRFALSVWPVATTPGSDIPAGARLAKPTSTKVRLEADSCVLDTTTSLSLPIAVTNLIFLRLPIEMVANDKGISVIEPKPFAS